MQPEDIEGIYDDWAETYGRMYSSPEEPIEEARSSIGSILRKKIGSGTVLEVGCGVGFVSTALAQDGFEVTGIDLSERSLEHARDLLVSKNLTALIEHQDITTFTPNTSFHGVVAVGSLLEAILDEEGQHKALQNMVSALRPGGYLVIGLHDAEERLKSEPDVVIQSVYRCVHDNGETLNFRTREWGPRPRNRMHVDTFYQICDGERLAKARLAGRCIFHREVSEILTNAGMEDIHWMSPNQAGYYQPLCVARKKAALENTLEGETPKKKLVVVRRPAKMKAEASTMVMWSGGLDSTYLLSEVLSNAYGDVNVHHVNMVLPDESEDARSNRQERTQSLLQLFRNMYPSMKYTGSSIDLATLNWSADRCMIAMYFGAQAVMTAQMSVNSQILFGLCAEENDEWGPNSLGFWQQRQLLKCIMRSEEPPQLVCPKPPLTKQSEFEALPKEMRTLFV